MLPKTDRKVDRLWPLEDYDRPHHKQRPATSPWRFAWSPTSCAWIAAKTALPSAMLTPNVAGVIRSSRSTDAMSCSIDCPDSTSATRVPLQRIGAPPGERTETPVTISEVRDGWIREIGCLAGSAV